MLLALQGSEITSHDGHVVVRTPENPSYHSGNFLLLIAPPAPGAVSSWVAEFSREFPDASHLLLGVDGTAGEFGSPDEVAAAGLIPDLSTVMTASSVHLPLHPNESATFRMLTPEDWAPMTEMREACNVDHEPAAYRAFVRPKMAALRRLQEEGHGGWFGAFLDGLPVAGLGIFTDGSGIARFQSVNTLPGYWRQGLAGTLVYEASRYAFSRLGVRTLVMVADPDDAAIRLYRSLGFEDSETQAQLFRPTSPTTAG
ncbi:hypothetical protein HUW46_05261 [Amycolatopsis sp. CA-230715]|nr:hypothetical protein HUW46_05261 [Amycolatopsis sp. CA-230715]